MVIVVLGPTCVGKTKLGVMLAKKYNGEVINADSTQVYKGLDIATAKVTRDEMDGVVHHLIDIHDIDYNYTVYDFQKDARGLIDDIISRGKTPILVGGTGLYIKACLYDYHFEDNVGVCDYSNFSLDYLYDRLISIDPNSSIHKNNRRRIERFLSYYDTTGKVLSSDKTDTLLYDTVFIGLFTSREVLYDRINNRVDYMIENGLIDEARHFYNLNVKSKALMTPIGYKELFLYFDGLISYDRAIDLIKQRSRNYAKRQFTWFNNQMSVKWFDVCFHSFDVTFNEVCKYIDNL